MGFPFFADESLGGERSDAGYLWMAFALGSASGAMALVRLQERFPPQNVMLCAIGTFGCLMLLWPLADSLALAMVLVRTAGVADGPGLAATFAVRQQWAPAELHGQIFTTAVEHEGRLLLARRGGRRPAGRGRGPARDDRHRGLHPTARGGRRLAGDEGAGAGGRAGAVRSGA